MLNHPQLGSPSQYLTEIVRITPAFAQTAVAPSITCISPSPTHPATPFPMLPPRQKNKLPAPFKLATLSSVNPLLQIHLCPNDWRVMLPVNSCNSASARFRHLHILLFLLPLFLRSPPSLCFTPLQRAVFSSAKPFGQGTVIFWDLPRI